VTNNLQVQAGLTWESVKWAFAAPNDYWHPLSWLSHMLDWQMYGGDAGGHHLTSVCWHATNAVLAFFVFRQLTGVFWTSAFAAALFAWHPLRVESVVWITERKDVMSGCFFLLTLLAYTAYARRRHQQSPAWRFYLLSLLLFAVGLMCKPILVTLPVLLQVLDFWPLRRIDSLRLAGKKTSSVGPRWEGWPGLLREKIPFFGLSIATSIVTVLMQKQVGAFTLKLPLDARLGNSVVSVARYLGKFFWPFDLAVCYSHPGYWPASIVLGATVLTLGITANAWWQWQSRPWLLTGWLWFLIMLLPVVGLVQVGFQAMADRYTYLPSLGWELALLWSLRGIKIPTILRGVAWMLGGALLWGCVARTWNQEATWRDPVTLFQHATAVTEKNDVAEAFLGYTVLGLGRIEEATQHSEQALKFNPKNDMALYTLASVRAQQDRIDEAVSLSRKVRELNPTDAENEYLLGTLLLRQRRFDEALPLIKSAGVQRPDLRARNLQIATAELARGDVRKAAAYFEVAVAFDPTDAAVHFDFGLALEKLGQVDEALNQYLTAIELQPDYPEAHTELGLILIGQHKPADAVSHFEAALASHPNFAIAYLGLGRAQQQLGQMGEATTSLQKAVALAPENAAVLRAWAELLARRGQFSDAVTYYERAVKSQPNDAETREALGYVLLLSERRDEAAAQWDEALRLDPNLPGLRERLQKIRRESATP
jgi:Flp pilus assembly protein TadD